MRGITKAFPGIRALENVDFRLARGEVHGLCGENGAGKSTLMKILAGICPSDSGHIRVNGKDQHFHSPQDANAAGIAIVTQELNIVPALDVASNIMLGHEPVNRMGALDRRSMIAHASEIISNLGIHLPLNTEAGLLSRGDHQLIEICRALSVNAQILILDEPTSALAFREREHLFAIMAELTARGVGIVYISHILPEVRRVSDLITVLRDGRRVSCRPTERSTEDTLISDMVGRNTDLLERRNVLRQRSETVLEVSGLTSDYVNDVSLKIAAGEIVGLAGMMGSGRTELLRAIFGLDPVKGGVIKVGEAEINRNTPRNALRLGMALVPEDRHAEGIIAPLTVERNIALSVSPRKFVWADAAEERRLADRFMHLTGIRIASKRQEVGTLSGGNQQKVVISRVLAISPRILVLDEPTAGIDVGAKAEIAEKLRELAEQGTAILIASSELPELIALSDRVIVMRQGRVAAMLEGNEISEGEVLRGATSAGSNHLGKEA